MKSIKRILGVFCVLLVLQTVLLSGQAFAACSTSHYTDVSTGASYYAAVDYLYDHGIMSGTGSNKFSPANSVTRAQIIQVLWNALGKPDPVGTTKTFSDCSSTSYYYNAVRWASSSGVGIASGTGNGKFSPDNTVTQQDAMTFLYRTVQYCTYISKTSASETTYKQALANSSLTYKANVADYAKPAFGWAYSAGLTLTNSVNPKGVTPRSDVAQYIYRVIKKYQKKYALTVVNTNRMTYAKDCGEAMAVVFTKNGAKCNSAVDIKSSAFSSTMSAAFSQAKPLDMCYIAMQAHGSNAGLSVFSDGYLDPVTLRNEILKYKGTFTVFASGCDSGTYIPEGTEDEYSTSSDEGNNMVDIATGNDDTDIASNPELEGEGTLDTATTFGIEENNLYDSDEKTDTEAIDDEEDFFDADAFAKALVGSDLDAESLKGYDNKIKVLCSSKKSELSYSADRRAIRYWALGAGYDMTNKSYTGTLAADTNSDKRISLEEMYKYSYDRILADCSSDNIQHIVRYPHNDKTIILETAY